MSMLFSVPAQYLRNTDMVPNSIYIVKVSTAGIGKEEDINYIRRYIKQKFIEKGLKVLDVSVGDKDIYIKFIGAPIPWNFFLSWLPEILGAIGLILTGISIFLVWETAPWWTKALAVIGIGAYLVSLLLGSTYFTPKYLMGKLKEAGIK